LDVLWEHLIRVPEPSQSTIAAVALLGLMLILLAGTLARIALLVPS
jgi:hypothetical protein